jgi:S1-C subfamily serine protease
MAFRGKTVANPTMPAVEAKVLKNSMTRPQGQRAVIPNMDAQRAGIRSGDRITSINGEAATRWTQKRLRELKEGAEQFEVEIVRGEKSEKLQLGVATLVE